MSEKNVQVPAEIYSRIVGYFRPVNQWNRGKKEEFSERKTYKFQPNLSSVCNECQRDI